MSRVRSAAARIPSPPQASTPKARANRLARADAHLRAASESRSPTAALKQLAKAREQLEAIRQDLAQAKLQPSLKDARASVVYKKARREGLPHKDALELALALLREQLAKRHAGAQREVAAKLDRVLDVETRIRNAIIDSFQ